MIHKLVVLRRRLIMAYRRWRRDLRYVHPTAYVSKNSYVAPDVRMGPHSFVNTRCYVEYNTDIGKYTLLGPSVSVVGGDHITDRAGTPMVFAGRPEQPHTNIGDDAWIGQSSVIMAGVTIGRGAIVGAGTVVTKDVPPYEIHVGVPNRKLKDRFSTDEEIAAHDAMLDGPVLDGVLCGRKKHRFR